MLKGINLVFYKKLIKWFSSKSFYTAKTAILILTTKKKKQLKTSKRLTLSSNILLIKPLFTNQ